MDTRSILFSIGFTEVPYFTIMDSLIYDLGRNRRPSFGSIGTPNEMLFIYDIDRDNQMKAADLICLRNYDYDGFTSAENIKATIRLITGRVF